MPQGQCEQQSADYCDSPSHPQDPQCRATINGNEWTSGSLLGADWVDFGRNKSILMHLRDQNGAQLHGAFTGDVNVFVSATPRPNDPNNNFVPCAGNLCEFNVVPEGNGWAIFVVNNTCADYFVYARFETTPSADASTE